MRIIRGNQLAGLAVLAATFTLAACGPSPSASSAAPTQGSGSSTAPAASGAPAASAPAPGSGASAPAATPSVQPGPAKFVPLPTGGAFASPTGNITCQITAQQAYCQSGSPARSVTMSAAGQYKTCTGEQCLGNAGEGTPTLKYGTVTGTGSIRCQSATIGMICLSNGLGFQLSTSGVTSVSS